MTRTKEAHPTTRQYLASQKRGTKKSMAGALAHGKKWTTEEILEGLRDKVDRF